MTRTRCRLLPWPLLLLAITPCCVHAKIDGFGALNFEELVESDGENWAQKGFAEDRATRGGLPQLAQVLSGAMTSGSDISIAKPAPRVRTQDLKKRPMLLQRAKAEATKLAKGAPPLHKVCPYKTGVDCNGHRKSDCPSGVKKPPNLAGMRRCTGRGEPHFHTFDGQNFALQTNGIFVLAKTKTLEVQGRILSCCFYQYAAKITDPDGKSYVVEFFRAGSTFALRKKGQKLPSLLRGHHAAKTFGSCNRMFFWKSSSLGRYDGHSVRRGYALVQDYKGNTMLFLGRSWMIFLRKGEQAEGLCGNNNGKKDDLPYPYKDIGGPPKTLSHFLRKVNNRHAMNCNAPLAIFAKRYNVDSKTVLLYKSKQSMIKAGSNMYNYKCPRPKKCSKTRLRKALKACAIHAKGYRNTPRRYRDCIVDICMTGDTKWAKEELTAAARVAAMRRGGDSERPAKKGCFEIGAKYHDSISGKYWVVGASGKPTKHKCSCKPTKRRLDGSMRSNRVVHTMQGQNLFKVKVNGVMNAANLRNACQKKQMKPVCDHNAWRNRCVGGWSSGKNLHFSHPAHDRRMGIDPHKLKGVFIYTGRVASGAMFNTGRSHRWATRRDRNQYTLCARRAGKGAETRVGGNSSFKWRGKNFYKVRVPGIISKHSLIAACRAKKLKVVCNYYGWTRNDRNCWNNKENKFWSYPPHNRNIGIPVSKVRGLFFYSGRVSNGVMYNTGASHRWMRNGRERGWTLCEGHMPVAKPKKLTAKELKALKKKFLQVRGQVGSVCANDAAAEEKKRKEALKKAKEAARRAKARLAKARKDKADAEKKRKLAAAARAAKKAAIAAKKAAVAAKKAAIAKKKARDAAVKAAKDKKDKASAEKKRRDAKKARDAKEKAARLARKEKALKQKAFKARINAANKKPVRKAIQPKLNAQGKPKGKQNAPVKQKELKPKPGKAPRVIGEEKQQEKNGNKRRHRARKGAGVGNAKGCKVTEEWANAHLKWCPWAGWSQWKTK